MGGPSEVPGTSNTLHHPNPSLRQPIHFNRQRVNLSQRIDNGITYQKLAPPPLERARGKKEFNRSSRSINLTSRPKQCVTYGTIRKL